jgi:hypothetical protein
MYFFQYKADAKYNMDVNIGLTSFNTKMVSTTDTP